MQKTKLLNVKSITKRIEQHFNKNLLAIECESPVDSERFVKDFVKNTRDYIMVDGKKYKILGIGYRIPKIVRGEIIKIMLELKGGKKSVKDKKHKSKG